MILGNKKKKTFSKLFDKFYQQLYNYAFKRLIDKDRSEEVVQECFIKVWENFETIKHNDQVIKAYLFKTLKNKIIDQYRKESTKQKHNTLYELNLDLLTSIDDEWEIQEIISEIYVLLPPKTVEIFKLSREHGLTYTEIAIEKSISKKTVELHISKALKVFREKLKKEL